MSASADYDEWAADDERRKRACEERGLVIRRPADNELLVDIDTAEQLAVFHIAKARLGPLVIDHDMWPSPSGRPGRYHASVRLSRQLRDDQERILLQAVLGSDLMRELLSFMRLDAGVDDATVFFERAP